MHADKISPAQALVSGGEMRVAVLPIENLSGSGVPIAELRRALIKKLHQQGLGVIEDGPLKAFMAKYRIRYTGGVNALVAQALKDELAADAVLITSLELYDERTPAIALTSRLVLTGTKAHIDWMESVALTGLDAPGILDLGLITDFHTLEDKALTRLAGSLEYFLTGRGEIASAAGGKGRYRPKLAYNAQAMDTSAKNTLTVVPFVNESKRKRAGEIMMLHFVRELARSENIEVIEPGIVREKMLNSRMTMNKGIANLDVDMLSIPLEADFVVSGRVFDYEDSQGPVGVPRTDFSVLMMQRFTRKVVWGSKSYNAGDDGELLFGLGKILTAHALVSRMVKSVVAEMQTVTPLPVFGPPIPEAPPEEPNLYLNP